MTKKRAKQAAIIEEVEKQIAAMPETEAYGFTYAVNLALSRHFNLPAPELPGARISKAVKQVDSQTRSRAGKLGAESKWKSDLN